MVTNAPGVLNRRFDADDVNASIPEMDSFNAGELKEPKDGCIVTAETFTDVVDEVSVSNDIELGFIPLAISSEVSGVSMTAVPSLGEIAAAVTRNESSILVTGDSPAYS